jgi:hypothetical protein
MGQLMLLFQVILVSRPEVDCLRRFLASVESSTRLRVATMIMVFR